MALVLPTDPQIPPLGRRAGSVFFRARGRTLARGRVAPVNPRTTKQSIVKGRFARASKVYAYTLSLAQQEQYSAFSKFEFRGQLEYASTSIMAALTNQAEPLGRNTSPIPSAPIIKEISYKTSIFEFVMEFEDPDPSDDWAGTASMTPPRPEHLKPTTRMVQSIFGAENKMEELSLAESYLDHYDDVEPLFRELICRVQQLQRSVPASSSQSIGASTPEDNGVQAIAIVNSSPIPKLGTSSSFYFVKFDETSEPDNITLRVTTPDTTNTFPTTIENDTMIDATISDELGVTRTSMFRFVATTVEGEASVLVLPVRIAW